MHDDVTNRLQVFKEMLNHMSHVAIHTSMNLIHYALTPLILFLGPNMLDLLL